MELDRNQPSVSRLRETLAPWFDNPAAWLALLCIALSFLTAAAVSIAAIVLAWRAANLPGLRLERRRAWRWLATALIAQLVAVFAAPAISGLLQFAFLACAALAASGFLMSTRGKAFGAQFWLEATLVALCVGAVLWLALPARSILTAGPGAVVGVLAAILLLRRSDWRGWPALVTVALALGAIAGAHLLEAHAVVAGTIPAYAGPLRVAAIAAFGAAAYFEYLRIERHAPPMDAAERGSPFAPLMPYAALMLAGYALLILHEGSFGDPAGLIAWVVCIAAGLLFARQAIATALAV